MVQWHHGVVVVGYGVGPSSPWMWGGGGPSLLLVLGCGGSSPHLHMLIDLLGLVTWPDLHIIITRHHGYHAHSSILLGLVTWLSGRSWAVDVCCR